MRSGGGHKHRSTLTPPKRYHACMPCVYPFLHCFTLAQPRCCARLRFACSWYMVLCLVTWGRHEGGRSGSPVTDSAQQPGFWTDKGSIAIVIITCTFGTPQPVRVHLAMPPCFSVPFSTDTAYGSYPRLSWAQPTRDRPLRNSS